MKRYTYVGDTILECPKGEFVLYEDHVKTWRDYVYYRQESANTIKELLSKVSRLQGKIGEMEDLLKSNLKECPFCGAVVRQTFEGLFIDHEADCLLMEVE